MIVNINVVSGVIPAKEIINKVGQGAAHPKRTQPSRAKQFRAQAVSLLDIAKRKVNKYMERTFMKQTPRCSSPPVD